MKALTFLGVGDYQTVTYYWSDAEGERECQTHLFPEAVARIFEPERILVFVTEQAKKSQNFQTLCQRLGKLVEPIDIPEGKSEAELWEIFERVVSSVEEGETVLLDITHAFRSIPMLVFTVAAYLRRTKRVTIERIIYGAFEARDEENRAPIFDLTPLLDLLDWLSGAEFFIQRSDAALLADRLISVQNAIRRQAKERKVSADLPTNLKNIGSKLQLFSQALHLARPSDVMRYAYELLPLLEKAESEAERWAKPFAVILEQVRSEVAKFAHDKPDRLDKEILQKQLVLIRHFVDKGLLTQAVLLVREWVGRLPKSGEAAQVWDRIRQLRNDSAHCGMRKDVARIQKIQRRANELPGRLQVLMEDTSVAHALHGKAKRLVYTSPTTGEVVIFDHSAR